MFARKSDNNLPEGLSLTSLSLNIATTKQIPVSEVLHTEFQERLKLALSVPGVEPQLRGGVTVEREWRDHDGVDGQLLSYASPLGGPKIEAYVLRPANTKEDLPGVIALHCHGNFKVLGKEKIADDDSGPLIELRKYRDNSYGGRAFANELAKRGFMVLVPDTFLWGSRCLDSQSIPAFFGDVGETIGLHPRFRNKLPEASNFDSMSRRLAADNAFEPQVENFLRGLNTSLVGVVNLEDRVSVQALRSLRGLKDPNSIAAIGLSGGGNRAGLLLATDESIKAAVIAGMMGTYSGLRESDKYWMHSSLFYPPNIPGQPAWEWPDIVGSAAKSKSLCCLNNDQDPLFNRAGQAAAHERLKALYKEAQREDKYLGLEFPGHHKFDLNMQDIAFDFLKRTR
jgi:dienelactone hydrolase